MHNVLLCSSTAQLINAQDETAQQPEKATRRKPQGLKEEYCVR